MNVFAEKARKVPDEARAVMTAESLALVFDRAVDFATSEVIQAIAVAFAVVGDPLEKVWIETRDGRKGAHPTSKAIDLLIANPDFRSFHAIPRSELRNNRSRWLSAAMAFCNSRFSKVLFLGIPAEQGREQFMPHVTLLRGIAKAGVLPQYGFGFRRVYGLGPGYFAIGHVFSAGGLAVPQADWVRIMAWGTELAGDPERYPTRHRYARGLLLDAFPINVLTPVHLQQKIDAVPLRDWIVRRTGPASLIAIHERLFVWQIPEGALAELSVELDEAGLIIARPGFQCVGYDRNGRQDSAQRDCGSNCGGGKAPERG